ncbi:MAG: hypothetical protein WD851_11070 [Pirellulales bacterium]
MLHEIRMFATAMVAFASLVFLSHRWYNAIKLHRRFSLRDMLVFITFLAALTGLLKGMANQEKDGIPAFNFRAEFQRHHEAAQRQEK